MRFGEIPLASSASCESAFEHTPEDTRIELLASAAFPFLFWKRLMRNCCACC